MELPGTSTQTDKLLPKYYLNADDLLRLPLPELYKGQDYIETVSHAPKIVNHYHGKLARWEYFQRDAMDFFKDGRTLTELKRCFQVPIYMDPEVEEMNPKAMTVERLQAGAEISLSGRYFWNALAVTTHIVETLTSSHHGTSIHPNFLPKELTFGDAKIINKNKRVFGQEPDIVLKLPSAQEHNIRMIGELKFCVTVDFMAMVQNAQLDGGSTGDFRAILGQVVNYMVGHEVKYGFISNYTQNIFLQVRRHTDGNPCIYFSDIIKDSDRIVKGSGTVVKPKDDAEKPSDSVDEPTDGGSVRLGLFYLTQVTCTSNEEDWRINKELLRDIKACDWIRPEELVHGALATPLGVGQQAKFQDLPSPTRQSERRDAQAPQSDNEGTEVDTSASSRRYANKQGIIKSGSGLARRTRSQTAKAQDEKRKLEDK